MRTLLTEDFDSLIIPDKLASIDLEFEDLDVPVEQDCVEYTNTSGPMRDYGDTGEVDYTIYGTIHSWKWYWYEPTEEDFAHFLKVPVDDITQEMLDNIDLDDFKDFLTYYHAEEAAEDAAENYESNDVDWLDDQDQDYYDESLKEAKKRKKKPYDSMSITTGDIDYNIRQFNKRMGTDFPGNDNNNPSTVEASMTPDGGIGTACNGSSCEGLSEGANLTEAKRYVRRYYIRPQNIFCSNKTDILKALIELDNQNCSIYTLNNLGDEKDVTKLTNKDIIYYYDDGILYDKNHVKVMDYDLYIKHEENRDNIDVNQVSDNKFSDVYDDRMTDMTKTDEVKEDLNLDEAVKENKRLAAWNKKDNTYLHKALSTYRFHNCEWLGNHLYLKADLENFYKALTRVINKNHPIVIMPRDIFIDYKGVKQDLVINIDKKVPMPELNIVGSINNCIIGRCDGLIGTKGIKLNVCKGTKNLSLWANGQGGGAEATISIDSLFTAAGIKFDNNWLISCRDEYRGLQGKKAIEKNTFWTKEEEKSEHVSDRLKAICKNTVDAFGKDEHQVKAELGIINSYIDRFDEEDYFKKILEDYQIMLESKAAELHKNIFINSLSASVERLTQNIISMEGEEKNKIVQWLLENVITCKILAPTADNLDDKIYDSDNEADGKAAANVRDRYNQILDTYKLAKGALTGDEYEVKDEYKVLVGRVEKGQDTGVQFWGIAGLVTFTISCKQMLEKNSGCPKEIADLVIAAYQTQVRKGKNKIQTIKEEEENKIPAGMDATSRSYNYISLALAIITLMEDTEQLDLFVNKLNKSIQADEKQLVGVGESLEDPFDIDYEDIDLDIDNKPTNICCICGKEFAGYGNNPAPYKNTGICCDDCNRKYVIPARVKQLYKNR